MKSGQPDEFQAFGYDISIHEPKKFKRRLSWYLPVVARYLSTSITMAAKA